MTPYTDRVTENQQTYSLLDFLLFPRALFLVDDENVDSVDGL